MMIRPFQNLWILPIDRLPNTTIPLEKVFEKEHSFLYKPYLIFLQVHFLVLIFQIVSFLALSIFFPPSSLLTPNFKHFRIIDNFLICWIRYLVFLFLLYKPYYLKCLMRLSIINIIKIGATVIIYFWIIPQIHHLSFQNKNNN